MAKVRMLSCPTCKGPIDTTAMQLYTKEGFRDIHCKACGFHGRAKGIKCQCNLVWHLCAVHRQDPATHRSRRAPAAAKEKEGLNEAIFKDSQRPAPKVQQRRKKQKTMKEGEEVKLYAHEDVTEVQTSPNRLWTKVIEGYRKRLEQRKKDSAASDEKTGGGSIKDQKKRKQEDGESYELQIAATMVPRKGAYSRKRLREDTAEQVRKKINMRADNLAMWVVRNSCDKVDHEATKADSRIHARGIRHTTNLRSNEADAICRLLNGRSKSILQSPNSLPARLGSMANSCLNPPGDEQRGQVGGSQQVNICMHRLK
jgi:hypothetical protein